LQHKQSQSYQTNNDTEDDEIMFTVRDVNIATVKFVAEVKRYWPGGGEVEFWSLAEDVSSLYASLEDETVATSSATVMPPTTAVRCCCRCCPSTNVPANRVLAELRADPGRRPSLHLVSGRKLLVAARLLPAGDECEDCAQSSDCGATVWVGVRLFDRVDL